jgi:hypothetical protein
VLHVALRRSPGNPRQGRAGITVEQAATTIAPLENTEGCLAAMKRAAKRIDPALAQIMKMFPDLEEE